jgi:hypothetical protein
MQLIGGIRIIDYRSLAPALNCSAGNSYPWLHPVHPLPKYAYLKSKYFGKKRISFGKKEDKCDISIGKLVGHTVKPCLVIQDS